MVIQEEAANPFSGFNFNLLNARTCADEKVCYREGELPHKPHPPVADEIRQRAKEHSFDPPCLFGENPRAITMIQNEGSNLYAVLAWTQKAYAPTTCTYS